MKSFGLYFPWLLLGLVLAVLVGDRLVNRSSPMPAEHSHSPAAETAESTIDPICHMTVNPKLSHSLHHQGTHYYFCSQLCQQQFQAQLSAGNVPPDEAQTSPKGHTMRGIPTWMYQLGIALVLILSFGLFELVSWGSRRLATPHATSSPRWNLSDGAIVHRLLRWSPFRFLAQAFTVLFFLCIVVAGLFGNQNPAMNIAPLLTWTIWWAGLIFLILYFGKAWCYVCPWDAIATWMKRLTFWGPRKRGLGLELPWPRSLRNIWFAVVLFVLLTWIELGMGITLIPRATAWIALGILGLTVVSVFLFERKAFCRYACLVGRVSGLYALFAGLELRSKDQAVCQACRTPDCYRGNQDGDGCPTFEFPKTMTQNTYCILCAECIKTCAHDNIALFGRPWGSDLINHTRPRNDEAILALILLAMTSFHGLTMAPIWQTLVENVEHRLGFGQDVVFAGLMGAVLVIPIAIYGFLSWISTWFSKPHGFGTIFIEYAYAMLPIALFYHLAHNAEHFFMEGPKVLALVSDPMGWGWNLFGTAHTHFAPLLSLEGLWVIQLLFVLVGHVYGLWIATQTTRRLIPSGWAGLFSQVPMLAAMVLFSIFSLWLLNQPMEMRSAM